MTMTKTVQLGAAAFLVVFILIYGLAGFTTVAPGEYAIVIQQFGEGKGVKDEGLSVGTHWVDPTLNDVEVYDTKATQHSLEVGASTKDGQPVTVHVSLEISLEADKVKDLHQLIGRDYYRMVVEPAARAAIRDALPTQLSDTVYTDEGRRSIQDSIIADLEEKQVGARGIVASVNLQEVRFTNEEFLNILEAKAGAAQQEEIQRRNAAAAEQKAIAVANTAEGEKQRRIKEAEAGKEELRLAGEGAQLRDEAAAAGLLAIAKAQAEGRQLLVNAYGGGAAGAAAVVGIAWAENLGPNVKVYGVPTGAPGTTTLVDLNSVLQGALGGITQ